jgi:hypothetical protein
MAGVPATNMFRKGRGMRIHGLTYLGPVLREWQKAMERLSNDFKPDDVPWWHNERAWVGVLAAATWKAGGRAFEEYSDEKIKRPKKGRPKKVSGRVDLWIRIGSKEYVIEAKHIYVNIGGRKSLPKINDAIKVLRSDISRVRAYPGQKKLRMVCVTPCLIKSKGEQIDELITRFLIQPPSRIKGATMAWIFPEAFRTFSGGDKYFYPGAVVILKPLRSCLVK